MALRLFVFQKETIENVVVIPLNTLVSLFNAPTHVIEKRFDKLLDYNNQLGKTENDKVIDKTKNDKLEEGSAFRLVWRVTGKSDITFHLIKQPNPCWFFFFNT